VAKVYCLMTVLFLVGCSAQQKPIDSAEFLRSIESSLASTSETIVLKQTETIGKTDEAIGILRENTTALAEIKSQIEALKVESETPKVEEVIKSAVETAPGKNANDSQPVTMIVAEPGAVRLYVSCADNCPPCNRLKADVDAGKFSGFEVIYEADFDGLKSYPAIRFREPSSHTGWRVRYGYDAAQLQWLRDTLLPTTAFVTQSRNTKAVVSHGDLVSIHNSLHGGGNWTWPGDLASHLRATHGVDLNGFPASYATSGITSQRTNFRSTPRRTTYSGRTSYSSRGSCPTCPR